MSCRDMAIGPFGLAKDRYSSVSRRGEVGPATGAGQSGSWGQADGERTMLVTPLDVARTPSIVLLTRPIGTRRISEPLTGARTRARDCARGPWLPAAAVVPAPMRRCTPGRTPWQRVVCRVVGGRAARCQRDRRG